MRVLITNDDGIDSPGLRVLAEAAESHGAEVVVAAPDWDSSGASASLTAVEEDGRFLLAEATLDRVDGRCVAVQAAPAFIARAAVHGAFGPPPDLVLSGINRGLNCGHAVLHSGTVGAASTAFTYGTRAAAFSIDASPDPHWSTAATVVDAVLDWFDRTDASVLLNVNVPDVPPDELRGLRPAALAAFGAVTANVTDVGSGYVAMEYRAPDATAEPGTDVALVSERYATFTALEPICRSGACDVGDLTI